MAKTKEQCVSEHGAKAKFANVGGVEFVYVMPKAADYRRFRAMTLTAQAKLANPNAIGFNGAETVLEAFEQLCKFTVVSHSAEELDAAAERYFDTFEELGNEIDDEIKRQQGALGKASEPSGTQPSTAQPAK